MPLLSAPEWTIAHTATTWARGEYEIELESAGEGEDLAFATVLVFESARARHEPSEPRVTVVSCDSEAARAWLEAEAHEYTIGRACLCGVSREGFRASTLQTPQTATR